MSTRNRKRGNRFKTHWTPERVIEAIRTWYEEHGESPRRTDWDSNRCHKLAEAAEAKAREWRLRAVAFTASDLPAVRTVVELFGSWNAAIEAAGLVPRLPSQRTPRGAKVSHFLNRLGHCVRAVYDAEDSGDTEMLRLRLKQLARVATQLAKDLEGDEESIAKLMAEEDAA